MLPLNQSSIAMSKSCALLLISSLRDEPAQPLAAIDAIDRAIIVTGSCTQMTERISIIEKHYHNVISGFNRLWKPSFKPDCTYVASAPLEESILSRKFEDICNLSPDDFALVRQTPFVVRAFAADWPAISLWKDPTYFSSRWGHRLVPVECGSSYNEPGWHQKIMPLGKFFEEDGVAIRYMAQHDLLNQYLS